MKRKKDYSEESHLDSLLNSRAKRGPLEKGEKMNLYLKPWKWRKDFKRKKTQDTIIESDVWLAHQLFFIDELELLLTKKWKHLSRILFI